MVMPARLSFHVVAHGHDRDHQQRHQLARHVADQRYLPRLGYLHRPGRRRQCTASGVSTLVLWVSVNSGPFTPYQVMNIVPTASGTETFTFVGQDRNTYAFHSNAVDATGNAETKNPDRIEASTSVPDLNPPATHVLASTPSYSWGPFPSSSFSGLTPSSYSDGVFTLNWAGADPDRNSGTPTGSIAVVNIYVEIDGGTPTLVGQLTRARPIATASTADRSLTTPWPTACRTPTASLASASMTKGRPRRNRPRPM